MQFWECEQCGATVYGAQPGDHRCQAVRDRVARGFEVRRPTWLAEASPPEELLTRVNGFIKDRIDWGWRVFFDEGRIVRQIQVGDPDLPPPHIQFRNLENWEDWEPAFRELGLLL